MKPIYLFLFSISLLSAQTQEAYFAYLEKLKMPNGSYQQGEIEVVVDPEQIAKIEEIQKKRLIRQGMPEPEAAQCSKTGIISKDTYWVWIRDAVYFPKGIPGTYDRLIKLEGSGAVMLPLLRNGRLVVNLTFRHATRSWELELPRGSGKKGETLEQTAIRELKEETGLEADTLVKLGELASNTGMNNAVVPVFLGRVSKQGLTDREYCEVIADVLSFTKEELKQGLLDGFIEVSLHGKKQKVPLRDPYIAFAILQAEMRKLI
jgi:ADP-ribose pyrophosphatase